MRIYRHVVCLSLWAAAAAWGHQQPTSLLILEAQADRVSVRLHLPLNELELAFGHTVTDRPAERMSAWAGDLRRYLRSHLRAETLDGRPWAVEIGEVRLTHAEQPQSGPFDELLADAVLTPPPGGANVREFVLRYDAILHQVVTHRVIVSVGRDWQGGNVEGDVLLGRIVTDTGTGRVEPFVVRLGTGSSWDGFAAMVRLGMRHIREGTDHMLFLLVLLLPLPYTFGKMARIITAFTLGHSLTLLAGALDWLRLPQQPVEILIAISILVTAVHAIRPLFPGREAAVTAGFGMVHGMAFATVLSGLHLPPGQMALSILGFNLGIELMQLLVVALTLPWLILLASSEGVHRWVRIGGATFAAIAACGWILNRVTGEPNSIERAMAAAGDLAPAGIFILAGIALPVHLYQSFLKRRQNEQLI